MPHDHVQKLNFWPPSAPQVPNPGAWPRGTNENPLLYALYRSFVRKHTKFGFKIFEIDFVVAPGGGGPKIMGSCICHTPNLVQIWNRFFDSPTPTVPPRPTHGVWPRRPKEYPIWYVFYLSFVRRNTKFGLKIFEMTLWLRFNDIWPFAPHPQGPRGQGLGQKIVLLHVSFI